MKEEKSRELQERNTYSSWNLSPTTLLKQSGILKRHALWRIVPVLISFK